MKLLVAILLAAVLLAGTVLAQALQLIITDSSGSAPPATSSGFDATFSAATMTLSGTNSKIATSTAPNDTWRTAESLTAHCTGKYYGEVTLTGTAVASGVIGVAGPFLDLNTSPSASTNVHLIAGWQSANNGPYGVTSGTALNFASGDTVSVAIDIDNNKIWVRLNGGAWAGGGDPAANTTPSGISDLAFNGGVKIAGMGFHASGNTDILTLNLSTAPTYTVPSGFTAWDGVATCAFSAGAHGFDPATSSVRFTFSDFAGTTNAISTRSGDSGNWYTALSVTGHSTGKYCATFKMINTAFQMAGIGDSSTNVSNLLGIDGHSLGFYYPGTVFGGSSTTALVYALSDIVDLCVDLDAAKTWIRKNGGAYAGGGDPTTGSSPSALYSFTGTIFMGTTGLTTDVMLMYTGSTPPYTYPSGYSAWQ